MQWQNVDCIMPTCILYIMHKLIGDIIIRPKKCRADEFAEARYGVQLIIIITKKIIITSYNNCFVLPPNGPSGILNII